MIEFWKRKIEVPKEPGVLLALEGILFNCPISSFRHYSGRRLFFMLTKLKFARVVSSNFVVVVNFCFCGEIGDVL